MSQFSAFFKKISVPAWIGLGVAAAAIVWLCIYLSRPKPRAAELPVVAVMPVGKEDVSIYGEFAGRIRAQQFVEVRARVEGYLQSMKFREGSYVDKGDRPPNRPRRSLDAPLPRWTTARRLRTLPPGSWI